MDSGPNSEQTPLALCQSASALIPLVYDELRRIAQEKLHREKPGQTLTATGLVHEAFLRLSKRPSVTSEVPAVRLPHSSPDGALDSQRADHSSSVRHPLTHLTFRDESHFLAAAAEAMRRILVEQARRRGALKRGGDRDRDHLSEDHVTVPARNLDLLALDEALSELEKRDPGKGMLVKLLHFVGMTVPEAAKTLGISVSTAERWWAYSRAWLFDRLQDSDPNSRRRKSETNPEGNGA